MLALLGKGVHYIHTMTKKELEAALKTKYPIEQMDAAFKKVQDNRNWKNPINAVIDAGQEDITTEAIIFYTGSIAQYTPAGKGKVRVEAAGYYLTIGS